MTPLPPYFELVSNLIRQQLDSDTAIAGLTPETAFFELGLDSLATVNLMVTLADEADVDLEDFADDLDTPATVGALCQIAAVFHGTEDAL